MAWLGWLGIAVGLGAILVVVASDDGLAQGKDPAQAIKKHDKDGDGKVSRKEWKRSSDMFGKIDTDGDGFLTYDEFKERFEGRATREDAEPESGQITADGRKVTDAQTTEDALDEHTYCGIGRWRSCDIKVAIERGLFETGLRPRFPEGAECRDIDEQWAISYTAKRDREQYHGGIDMPAPWGVPMIAAAAGTVIAKYVGANSYRGKEIILRHSPEDTGLPLWIYTQYAHFDEMPKQKVGDRVRMGEELGPTGNSGRGRIPYQQSGKRRPAIHFAIWYSTNPQYVALRTKVIPVEGWWMDPNALYRKKLPVDTQSLRDLPEDQKQVPISIMYDDGEVDPADTKLVWPYTCKRR